MDRKKVSAKNRGSSPESGACMHACMADYLNLCEHAHKARHQTHPTMLMVACFSVASGYHYIFLIKFLRVIYFYIMWVSVLFVCTSVKNMHAVPSEVKRGC